MHTTIIITLYCVCEMCVDTFCSLNIWLGQGMGSEQERKIYGMRYEITMNMLSSMTFRTITYLFQVVRTIPSNQQ